MNHDLIDLHILDLLRIPVEERTQERVALALTDIADAAQQVTDTKANPLMAQTILQKEQLKLAAIADFLRQALELEHGTAELELRAPYNEWDKPLTVILSTDKSKTIMVGRGQTAEEALRELRTIARSEQAA